MHQPSQAEPTYPNNPIIVGIGLAANLGPANHTSANEYNPASPYIDPSQLNLNRTATSSLAMRARKLTLQDPVPSQARSNNHQDTPSPPPGYHKQLRAASPQSPQVPR